MSGEARPDTTTGPFAQADASITASMQWAAFCNDPRARQFHLAAEVERDAPLDISFLSRPVQFLSDHPQDQLSMQGVPGDMTVHFHAIDHGQSRADRRDIALLPSQAEFLGWHGLLPAIDVVQSVGADDSQLIWHVAAPGDDAGVRFLFAADAAPLAQASLAALQKAAVQVQVGFEQLRDQLAHGGALETWSGPRRLCASHYWQDLPARIRHRVITYFHGDARAAALISGAHVGTVLRDSHGSKRLAVAAEMLSSGLVYWCERAAATAVPEMFWQSEMARAIPFNATASDFAAALTLTLRAYARWCPVRQFYRDVLRDMDRSPLCNDSRYLAPRRILLRALMRGGGQRVGKSGSMLRDRFDGLDPEEVRQRLAAAQQQMPANVAAVGATDFNQALATAMTWVSDA